jgi:S-adenosylmethionine synthetase
LTGRKIICDQYGGFAPVGGGAFSGKDPTKVDRSGAYAARELACKVLKENNLEECTVQLAYAIGVSEPVSINISTKDGELDARIYLNIKKSDYTPDAIIKRLNLRHIKYENMAEGCHYRL